MYPPHPYVGHNGWITDILDGSMTIGEHTHDLLELFLPKSVNASETNGTFADYHSVDVDADMLTGRPYSYIEEYQSYEQTGTTKKTYWDVYTTGCSNRQNVAETNVKYWSQYGSGCPKWTYKKEVPAQSYWDVYDTSCSYYESEHVSSKTYWCDYSSYWHKGGDYMYMVSYMKVNAGYSGFSNISWADAFRQAGCRGFCPYANTEVYYSSALPCNNTDINTNKTQYCIWTGAGACNFRGGYKQTIRTYGYCKAGSVLGSCRTSNCPFPKYNAVAGVDRCSYSGSRCAQSGCNVVFSSNSAYVKCKATGGTCATSSCSQIASNTPIMGYVTRTRTIKYDKESGIFATGIGIPQAAKNRDITGVRICKN